MAQKSKTFIQIGKPRDINSLFYMAERMDLQVEKFLADGKKLIDTGCSMQTFEMNVVYAVTLFYEDPAPGTAKLDAVGETEIPDEAPPSNAEQFLASVRGASPLRKLPEIEPAAATSVKTESASNACESCDVDSLTSCNTCPHFTD